MKIRIILYLPRWCLHLNVVGEFASFRDPESYAGGTVATGRVSQAGQVKGWKPDEERHLGPPSCVLGIRPATLSRKKSTPLKILKYWKPDRLIIDDQSEY